MQRLCYKMYLVENELLPYASVTTFCVYKNYLIFTLFVPRNCLKLNQLLPKRRFCMPESIIINTWSRTRRHLLVSQKNTSEHISFIEILLNEISILVAHNKRKLMILCDFTVIYTCNVERWISHWNNIKITWIMGF